MKIKIDTTFNKIIKRWREKSGLTLEETSKLTEFSETQITLYECEKQSVSIQTLQQFAKAFGLEIDVNSYKKGNIIMTQEQKEKIKKICDSERSVNEKFNKLKGLFDITWEETFASKLLDDMDIYDLVSYGPSETVFTDRGELFNRRIFNDAFELYVLCHGGKYAEKKDDEVFSHNLYLPNDLPENVSYRRTSKDGFITEQRRELLPLLKRCFKREEDGTSVFDYQTFKKEIGW